MCISTCFTKSIVKKDLDEGVTCITAAYASCVDSEDIEDFFKCSEDVLADCHESEQPHSTNPGEVNGHHENSSQSSPSTCEKTRKHGTSRMCFNENNCRNVEFEYEGCVGEYPAAEGQNSKHNPKSHHGQSPHFN